MQYITEIESYHHNNKRSAVTLGKFNGLHRGHQRLIQEICRYAREDINSIVFAFDMGKQSLLTQRERRKHLEYLVDVFIQCPFTREIRTMEAETFIKDILVDRLKVAYMVVGTDFHFG